MYNVVKIDKDTHHICLDYIEINGVPSVNCHIDIYKWTKTTKPIILKDILFVAVNEPLDKYVVWDGKDKKFLKFITMVGFELVGETPSFGETEYLFKWRKHV